MEDCIMYRKLLAWSLPGLLPLAADASQLVSLDVSQSAGIYEIRVQMEVDAPADNVRAILTDYAHLERLNSSITSSEVIDTGRRNAVRVLTRIKNCVLFFCLSLKKVEDVTEDQQGRILVTIVPGSSSFRSGQASWEIRSLGDTSLVIHCATLEPDLWIPPWIGTAIVKDALRREIEKSFRTLDCLARTRCGENAGASHAPVRDDVAYRM
jgi:uncharacterized membrane protein